MTFRPRSRPALAGLTLAAALALAAAAHAGGSITTGETKMTTTQTKAFIAKFEKAWSTRNDADFVAIWHPEGSLVYPFVGRTIRGAELPILNGITKRNAPDLTWKMLGWTSRGDVIVVEWESSNRYGERVLTWRGVDKLTLSDGRILEEVVYTDTAPFQALRRGEAVTPLIPFPAAQD